MPLQILPAPYWRGGSFRLTLVEERQVRIDGEHKIYGRIADSGFEIRFHFCPNCGSSVFWEGDRGLDHYGIAVGCFADPDFPGPVYSAYEDAKHPWLDATSTKEYFKGPRPAGLPLPR